MSPWPSDSAYVVILHGSENQRASGMNAQAKEDEGQHRGVDIPHSRIPFYLIHIHTRRHIKHFFERWSTIKIKKNPCQDFFIMMQHSINDDRRTMHFLTSRKYSSFMDIARTCQGRDDETLKDLGCLHNVPFLRKADIVLFAQV